ncbi:MAG: hypothetical protein AB4038_06820 [Prochloraceae cyanobacterium]
MNRNKRRQINLSRFGLGDNYFRRQNPCGTNREGGGQPENSTQRRSRRRSQLRQLLKRNQPVAGKLSG